MHYSQLFGQSLRQTSQSYSRGFELLYRGGYLRESSSGRFFMLPLGMKVQEKICSLIETEMQSLGAQRISIPTLHPRELWEETNRTESAAFDLMAVSDRNQRQFILGGTAEEMVVDLVRGFELSWKNLPFCLYQFSNKFRDELRARAGLLRAREFLMKDAYSFHHSKSDLDSYYDQMALAYQRIFKNLEIPALQVQADSGYIGGSYCHEFVVPHQLGESTILQTPSGSYAAHQEVAQFKREHFNSDEQELPLKVMRAERGITIADGVQFYQQPAWRQIKSLIYVINESEKVLIALRGDLELNQTKLQKVLHASQVRLATSDEVQQLGTVVGFVSPLKLKIRKIGDLSLTSVKNFYTGADQWQWDTLNVNFGRDFQVDILADIACAQAGHKTEDGQQELIETQAIEVGHIFKLETCYSEKMERAVFLAQNGEKLPLIMGCYGIGIGRTLQTIAEIHHDQSGLLWPQNVAPFQEHLLSIGEDPQTKASAEQYYERQRSSGISILWDDRQVSAGVKLADADLLGIPKRSIISKKSLQAGGIEIKMRNSQTTSQLQLL